jgi:hypothetical protein
MYQLSQEEEKLLVKYLDTLIKEGKFRQSSSTVGRHILFLPKPTGHGLHLCDEYRHLNDSPKKDRTQLPIMEGLQSRMNKATHITKVNFKSKFYLIRMGLEYEKLTVFRIKFGLYKYMVWPFGFCNAPTTFQREINRILRPLLGREWVIKSDVPINMPNGIVVVASIHDTLIPTKGTLEKHHKQVSKVS